MSNLSNSLGVKYDKNIGVTSAKDLIKMAETNCRSRKDIPVLSVSSSLPPQSSKSKVLKRFAIHLIRFCLKSGISENKNIIKFLEENEVYLKGRTFDRYKSMAERELENDLDASIWLSEKTQNALVHDYKDISDRYDRQLALDDSLIDGLIKKAVDTAIQHDGNPAKYYRYLDYDEIMKIQAISNYTMKNKLELLSKGFLIFRIKKYIDKLHDQLQGKNNRPEEKISEMEINAATPLKTHSYSTDPIKDPITDLQASRQEHYKYLRSIFGDEISMSMNGIPMKTHLVEFEKKLGKPITSLG